MGFFSTDITDQQARAAQKRLAELEQLENSNDPQWAKEKQACEKLIAKYREQQQEAEDNLKSGFNTALSIIKRFLPKEVKVKIPDNAIDLLFGFFHKPEILVDKMNHEWESLCRQLGIPSEHIRIILQKAGANADVEAIIGIYNTYTGKWQFLEYSFRQAIEAMRGQGTGIDIKSDIQRAYGIQLQETSPITPLIALSENNNNHE
jgi:uncharacterized protein YpuA (DUF1002 family)